MPTTRPLRALLAASILLALTGPAGAQKRRITGKVLDAGGGPLAGVKVLATSPDIQSFKATAETSAKGEFALLVLLEAVSTVKLRMEKEGYVPAEDELNVLRDPGRKLEYKLESAAARAAQEAAQRGPDAAEVHNAGVEAARAGDWKTAAEKFEAALAVKEDVYQTHAMLAKSAFNLTEWARAEKCARRSLELNGGQAEMLSLLADSLDKQGRKDEATAVRQKLAEGDPKLRAELAYNRGAEAANKKNDAAALAAFEEAVTADPVLADAHYALGTTALRTGDTEKARTHLDRYLELEPEGRHASAAREMLKVLPSMKPKPKK